MQIITKALFSIDLDVEEVDEWDKILHVFIIDATPFLLGQFNVKANIKKSRNVDVQKSLKEIEEKISKIEIALAKSIR